MKKVFRKMVIRGETLRLLRALDERELARPVGGDATSPGAAGDTDSKRPICPLLTIAPG